MPLVSAFKFNLTLFIQLKLLGQQLWLNFCLQTQHSYWNTSSTMPQPLLIFRLPYTSSPVGKCNWRKTHSHTDWSHIYSSSSSMFYRLIKHGTYISICSFSQFPAKPFSTISFLLQMSILPSSSSCSDDSLSFHFMKKMETFRKILL